MRSFNLNILIFIFSILFSKSNFIEYVYDVEIKGLSLITGNVGKCNFKIYDISDEKQEMKIITKTTNLANFLYPYKDEIKLIVDSKFSLLSINQKISNSKKRLNIFVDKIDKKIFRNDKQLNFYSDTLFSPYSLIHYLKQKSIKINEEYNYNIFDNRKIENINLKVTKTEDIKVPYGKYNCFHIQPFHKKNLIKNDGKIELWFTNDEEQIPLKIILETKIGTFILKLKEVKSK